MEHAESPSFQVAKLDSPSEKWSLMEAQKAQNEEEDEERQGQYSVPTQRLTKDRGQDGLLHRGLLDLASRDVGAGGGIEM